ncbi:MAG TPA: DUF6011 domain-containing protein [Pirellulales bacterium]|jgi:hypothetical protein|nr:DUF6011 domain-containing protein [Pirellulales bacterium]
MVSTIQHQTINDLVQSALTVPQVCHFRQMLTAYFEQEQPVEVLVRRPQIGFRLPHGEYIFSVRPYWSACHKVIDPEIVLVEALRVALDERGRHSATRRKVVRLTLGPTHSKWTLWNHVHGQDALDNFIEMVRYFVLRPQDVFRRASDHCCCCGRRLQDQLSRTRGIGPECLQAVSPWLDRWVSASIEAQAKVEAQASRQVLRDEYLADTGLLPGDWGVA